MKRQDAEALVGQPVRAWTAANGVYAGTLESISGSPWRGTVRITGILEGAQHFERGAAVRRGFRAGETVEVGATSISRIGPDEPLGDVGPLGYMTALQRALEASEQAALKPTGSPHHWVHAAFGGALVKAMDAERRRLEGQAWSLHPDAAKRTSPRP